MKNDIVMPKGWAMKSLDSLRGYDQNARTHTDEQVEQIAASIREFGWTNPVLTDGKGGIIAGHGRVLAARRLGLSEVPVIELPHLTDAQRQAYVLADNQLALNAGWDEDILRAELAKLDADGFDLGLLGFDADELERLLAAEEDGALQCEEDAIPDAPEESITQPGDIWLLGEHRLLCGDSTDHATLTALLQDERVDMLFTDPPYGVSIGDKNAMLNKVQKPGRCCTNIANNTATPEELRKILTGAFTNARRHLADCCAVYVTAPQGGGLGMMMMMMMMMSDAGLEVRHILNWVKNSPTFSMGRLDYDYQHEPILFTWTKTHQRVNGGAHHSSCWFIDKPKKCDLHPTMKPVALVENAILNSSTRGNVVLDIFAGSGTTLIACEKTGRRARCVELDPHYCDVIVRRWEMSTGKQATREGR